MALRLRHASFLILVILLLTQGTLARFTQNVLWPGTLRSIQQIDTGAYCYVPLASESTTTTCTGDAADLQAALDAHSAQDLSVAYYDGATYRRLGGSGYEILDSSGVVRLCASGYAGNRQLYTVCTNVAADNTFSGSPACFVTGNGPTEVSDGCYDWIARQTTSTTSTTFTHTSTSSTTSSSSTTTSREETTSTMSSQTKEETLTTTAVTPVTPTIVLQPAPAATAPAEKSDALEKILVPIVVAVLGLLTAAVGTGFWRRRKERIQAQQNVDNQNMVQVAGAVHRAYV